MKAEDGNSGEVEDADSFAIDLEERLMVTRISGLCKENSHIPVLQL